LSYLCERDPERGGGGSGGTQRERERERERESYKDTEERGRKRLTETKSIRNIISHQKWEIQVI
jgi:hypothetical protein